MDARGIVPPKVHTSYLFHTDLYRSKIYIFILFIPIHYHSFSWLVQICLLLMYCAVVLFHCFLWVGSITWVGGQWVGGRDFLLPKLPFTCSARNLGSPGQFSQFATWNHASSFSFDRNTLVYCFVCINDYLETRIQIKNYTGWYQSPLFF